MAVLYVTEYPHAASDQGKALPVGFGAPIANQTVAIGGGSLQSAAFNANTVLIRVHCDAVCSVLIGANPTALTTSARMAANQTEYFGVQPGTKIAVISNA